MTTMSDLPEELVGKTLSKVPVSSLRSVRSTCKKWNDLSKNRIFGKPSNKQFVGFMMKDFRVCSLRFDLQGIRNEGVLVDPSIKQVSILNQVEISKIFHCDGLLLCVTKDNSSLVVWNPYLGQTRWIQPRTSFHRLDRYALGYDNNFNHKILRFVDDYLFADVPDGKHVFGYEIYDFSSNSWRVLQVTPDWEIEFYQRGATLKGNTYFFAKQKLVVPEGVGDDESIDTTETEDFLLCFDFTTERFGPRLPLPFHSYFDEIVTLSCVRDEQLAALLQPWDGSRVMEVWVTNKIDPNAVSWSMFLKVDMSPLTGFTFILEAASFFIDEEKKVAVVFDLDGRKPTVTRYQTAYIIGQDGYFNSVNIGEATNLAKPNICGDTMPIYCVPLVCSSSYVPSLVQLQINKTLTSAGSWNRQTSLPVPTNASTLPVGWVDAKGPASGATYYNNQNTGTCQWERPLELSSTTSSAPPLLHPQEEWIETLDETSGHKYYYNTKTHVSQWEPPGSLQKPATTNSNNAVTQNTANGKREHPPSQLPRCSGCGGWGVGLVQRWGYCSHCTRVFNLPEQQYLAASLNYFTNTRDSGQKDPNQRSTSKSPMKKGSGKKRAHDGWTQWNPSS